MRSGSGGPRKYRIVNAPGLSAVVSQMGRRDYETLVILLRHIALSPRAPDGNLTVYPLRDDNLPAAYTAALDRVLIVYQVMADHPVIKLLHVIWP